MSSTQKSNKQKQKPTIKFICLAEQCEKQFLLYDEEDTASHKHSKTDIRSIQSITKQLSQTWEPKNSPVDPYVKKSREFYDQLRKQVNKLIDEDQKIVENILSKLRYHHLPVEANSLEYLELVKGEFERLDKQSIRNLINEAQNGQLKQDLSQQKHILNYMDLELKKLKDKVLTLKYVLPSKKLQAQILNPRLSEPSMVADKDQFVKVYSLFNSRRMLIRGTQLIYRASQNDFSASSFYNNCIGVRNCLVLLKTTENKVYGGYSPYPLVHHDQEQLSEKGQYWQSDDTKKSFIFSITNLKSFSLKDSQKALKYRKEQKGPIFGEDLVLDQIVTSNLGNSYESPEGIQVDSLQAKVFLLESDKAEIKDFEIWQISF